MQHEISRRRAGRQHAPQFQAHHSWRFKPKRQAKYRGFGLDPADTPAENAERVDHRGVTVGSDHCIGAQNPAAGNARVPDHGA